MLKNKRFDILGQNNYRGILIRSILIKEGQNDF